MTPLEEAVARKLLDMASQRLGIDLGPWDSLDTNTKDRYLEDALGILALPEIVKMQEALDKAKDAIQNLRDYQEQLDFDGSRVGVSRQALEETLDAVSALAALQPLKKEAE